MKAIRKISKILSYLLTATLLTPMISALPVSSATPEGTNIDYTFSGKNADDSGYAQGTVTLSSDTDGTYGLYWADNSKAPDGYYEIDELTIADGKSAVFEFGDHTAIPAGATKLIAVSDKSDLSVSGADAVYSIPTNKQLNFGSGELLYTFNSYSDVHIDVGNYYVNAEKNWAQALKFAVDKGTDFIVSSGDMVTNASGPESEWLIYEKVLAESDYVNPVWESDGNHDMRSGVSSGLTSFVRASGTDNTIANYDANKPYYYITEQSTGDIFIFMALESDSNPGSCDEFSQEQMQWLISLLDTYYGTGINIYIIEHSPIKGFGAGDRMDNPYYKAHLSENFISTVQFKSLLQKYPKLIWMSGHTHEDFSMGYNYSNENETACHMIHNPAVAGSTWASPSATSLDYNNGVGYNSQGYYVETYENQVVYYGTSEQGVDLYYCDIPVDHDNIIWNNAGNGYQTADIALDGINDLFTPAATTSSKSVPVTASVRDYDPVTQPTTAEPPEISTEPDEEDDYVLCYYNSGEHAWSDMDTYFVKQGDGTYTLDFTTTNSENISCNVYNNTTKTYNCVASSTSLTFAAGKTSSYDLTASSSRGKSLTINSLSAGSIINFVYNPTDNTLSVTCKGMGSTEPTESPIEQPSTPAGSDITYVLYMAPEQSMIDDSCSFKANIKDSSNSYHSYNFEKTDMTYNGATVYAIEITNPEYSDVVKIQFQTWDSAGSFVGQVVDEKNCPIAEYNNKFMVCTSAKSGALNIFDAD